MLTAAALVLLDAVAQSGWLGILTRRLVADVFSSTPGSAGSMSSQDRLAGGGHGVDCWDWASAVLT